MTSRAPEKIQREELFVSFTPCWWDGMDVTVRFDSIVVLAEGRRSWIGLGGVGFAPSNEDFAFCAGVCHLLNLFPRTMFKLRQGPVQFLGLFFGHWAEDFFLKRPRFWNRFGSFFGPGTAPGNDFSPLARLPCSASQKKTFCGWVQIKQILAEWG